jgi:hypothetical protein
MPAWFSEADAAQTVTARSRPRASVATLRFRPTIFLAASVPWVARGGLVKVLTVWVSMIEAVGSGSRPCLARARPVRS